MLIFEKDALRACLFEFAYLPLYILFALVGGASGIPCFHLHPSDCSTGFCLPVERISLSRKPRTGAN